MFITDPYSAYCLNEAVFHFGKAVEDRMEMEGASRGKHDNEKRQAHRRDVAFRKMLGLELKFASPTAMIDKAKARKNKRKAKSG